MKPLQLQFNLGGTEEKKEEKEKSTSRRQNYPRLFRGRNFRPIH